MADITHCATFEYTPLEAPGHIRLLRVLPGVENDQLRCECVVHDLEHDPDFTAISYTWGDPILDQLVLINDREYYTTSSAKEVLLALRYCNAVRTVWVDAICIDQHNLAEKTIQVQMMGQIYAHASKTVVWLGGATVDSTLAMEFISLLRDTLAGVSNVSDLTESLLLRKSGTTHGSPEWLALGNLLARPYWRRVWVIQEVALSSNVQVRCGDQAVSWEDMASVIDDLYKCQLVHLIQSPVTSDQLTTGASTFWAMQHTRRDTQVLLQQEDKSVSLSEVLFKTMGFLSTDPKDQIFGILGLVDWKNDLNYDNSAEQVYTKAVQRCIEEEQTFDILYLAGRAHKRNIQALPSWVPDFSIDIDTNPFGMPHPGQQIHYKAGGIRNLEPEDRIQIGGGILTAYGMIIDTIDILGHIRTASHQTQDPANHKSSSSWVRQAIELVACIPDLNTRDKAAQSLWRTLVADSARGTKHPAPANYKLYYELAKRIYIDDPRYSDRDWKEAQALASIDPRFSQTELAGANEYYYAFLVASIGRRFCITEGGRLSLVPSGAEKGDVVCVLKGASVPFMLRRCEDETGEEEPTYVLVGDCYVDGIMRGECGEDWATAGWIWIR